MSKPDTTVAAAEAAQFRRTPDRFFRVGWWVLIVLTALLVANHALGLLTFATSDDERGLFLIFLAFGLLSLVVLAIPYRRREGWAWWATWIPIVANALPLVIFGFDVVGAFYGGIAVVMAAAQIATRQAFGRRSSA